MRQKFRWTSDKRIAFMFLISWILLVPNLVKAEISFNKVVAFGTSLTDTGNAHVFTQFSHTPPYDDLDDFLIPETSYAIGGHHLSNGAIWIEHLTRPLGMKRFVRPAFHDQSPNANNFAVAGTRAHTFGGTITLADQVAAYLAKTDGTISPDTLFVFEIGSNDVRDGLIAFLEAPFQDPPQDPFLAAGAILQDALTQIFINISLLQASGAEQFFFMNVAPIGETPAINELDQMFGAGGAIISLTNTLADNFNTQLQLIALGLQGSGAEVALLDVNSLTNAILSSPNQFGLTVVDEACLTPEVAPFKCKKPDEYFFWDGIHPTKAAHAIFAEEGALELGIQ